MNGKSKRYLQVRTGLMNSINHCKNQFIKVEMLRLKVFMINFRMLVQITAAPHHHCYYQADQATHHLPNHCDSQIQPDLSPLMTI